MLVLEDGEPVAGLARRQLLRQDGLHHLLGNFGLRAGVDNITSVMMADLLGNGTACLVWSSPLPANARRPLRYIDLMAGTKPHLMVRVDNNLGASRGYLRRLCAALRPLDTVWTAAVTLDVTDDPSLVRDMSLAGCGGVFIGFETLNDENLASARKRGRACNIRA